MKYTLKIKKYFFKKILNILGISSIGLIASCAKYGAEVNTIEMQLKGKVLSADSLIPINGIKVNVSYSFNNSNSLSNQNGDFYVNPVFEANLNKLNLSFEDIDGEINGHFLSKDTVIVLTELEKKKLLKENIEIKLEKNE